MNIYPFRILIAQEKRGPALKFIQNLKAADTFKHARFDVFIPKSATSKIIVCLGQKHTVHRGRISRWGAKHIAKVQARLFSYYRFFHHKFKITEFGAEGAIANGKGSKFRYHDELLAKALSPKEQQKLKAEDESVHLDTILSIFKRLSLIWQKKMRVYGHDLTHGQQEIAPYASAVNGLRMYSYLAEDVVFFPIEGEGAYKHVSHGVRKNQEAMIRMARSHHYKSAVLKKGKGLTKEEYSSMQEYNKLVKAFNKAIKSNYREEASLALALENLAEGTEVDELDITVFTMGIGHRTNYKWLAPRYLKRRNVAFVLITAPELWWWKHVISRFFQCLVLIGFILLFLFGL